jgi:glutathione synthase/RimK-type ligase-like ATP-grasp enzyme
MDDPSGFVVDDGLAVAPLADLGVAVEMVPWRADADWGAFDAVVVRSPWDYQDDPDAFLAALERVDASGTLLLNGLDTLCWNLRKTYLKELEAAGIPLVPTVWRDRLAPGDVPALFDAVRADEVVVKPTVGANADGAFRISRAVDRAAEVEAYYADRALMAQPFVRSVVDEGEFSVFAFGGEVSHTILKTPKPRDFRVQEEHGGLITAVAPEPALLGAAQRVFDAVDRIVGERPLYARADLVRAPDGAFWLMEVELIEPALYFRMDAGAPARFARALADRVGG